MKCTHLALQVRNVDAAIKFYQRYCHMELVHDRNDKGMRVVWLGFPPEPRKFVIVFLESPYETNTQPPYQHIGIATETREEVDAAYALAIKEGVPAPWPPYDSGPIVGYYCGILDPDGNKVEFSFGQQIG